MYIIINIIINIMKQYSSGSDPPDDLALFIFRSEWADRALSLLALVMKCRKEYCCYI